MLPAASVNVLAATSMVAAPSAVGVNVAVYTVLEVAAKLLMAPLDTVMSPTAKSVVASLLVNVTVNVPSLVVEPSLTALLPSVTVIVIVGPVVSIIRALFAPKELLAPGEANVKTALPPSLSFIVPLFNANADVLL